jgi:hypothetical protein
MIRSPVAREPKMDQSGAIWRVATVGDAGAKRGQKHTTAGIR